MNIAKTTSGSPMYGMYPLNINPLLRVPLQVPARRISEVGKQRIDAGLILRRGELILGFIVLLVDDIHFAHADASEFRPAAGNAVAKRNVICRIEHSCDDN
jgi:hypothetical protein